MAASGDSMKGGADAMKSTNDAMKSTNDAVKAEATTWCRATSASRRK